MALKMGTNTTKHNIKMMIVHNNFTQNTLLICFMCCTHNSLHIIITRHLSAYKNSMQQKYNENSKSSLRSTSIVIFYAVISVRCRIDASIKWWLHACHVDHVTLSEFNMAANMAAYYDVNHECKQTVSYSQVKVSEYLISAHSKHKICVRLTISSSTRQENSSVSNSRVTSYKISRGSHGPPLKNKRGS